MSKFRMDIRISIRQEEPYPGGNLDLSETVGIDAEDFFDVARVLNQFHELAMELKAKKEGRRNGKEKG